MGRYRLNYIQVDNHSLVFASSTFGLPLALEDVVYLATSLHAQHLNLQIFNDNEDSNNKNNNDYYVTGNNYQ